jgi:hypothetical protein
VLRVLARLLTPRFAVFHLGEKSLHGASFTSVKDFRVTLMRLLIPTISVPTCSSTKAEVYQRRIKCCGISQL